MKQAGNFLVFSVDEPGSRVREVRSRKKHVKTASGCKACRLKRVKCDESKPICTRCRRNSRSCTYELTRLDERACTKVPAFSAVTVSSALSTDHRNGTPSLHLLLHLQRHWTEVLHVPQTDDAIELFRSNAAVRTTMLALAASHLRHRAPGVLAHLVAELYQQSLALREYQKMIDIPLRKQNKSDIRALLMNAAFLNMLAFTLPQCELTSSGEPDLNASWVFCTDEQRLGWLAMQSGLQPLLRQRHMFFADNVKEVSGIFLGLEAQAWRGSRAMQSQIAVPPRWSVFFDLDYAASDDRGSEEPAEHDIAPIRTRIGDIYRPLVMLLAELVQAGPSPGTILLHFAFMAKMQADFRDLLLRRDERALWLFGYWLGLMSRYEQRWWLDQRVGRDFRAIRAWLEQARVTSRPGSKGQIWRELMTELDLLQ